MAIAREIYPQKGRSSIKQYRSHVTVITDILSVVLEAGNQGVIISSLARRSNLSHYRVVARCKELLCAGLIESKTVEDRHVYIMTGKGRDIFQQIQRFVEMVKSLRVRL